jgi:hypothetical protein
MTFFENGNRNPQPGTPAVKCYAFTFGRELATGKVTPCTAQGERAEFVFGDTVDGVDTVPNGFGVPLRSLTHSGGTGIQVLAGGPIIQGHDIVVGMASFVDNDGVTVSLPVAIDVDDADEGDWIIGRASKGSSADAQDTINDPSIALLFYPTPIQVGGAHSTEVVTLHIDLALVANGDVVTDWTPNFAGEITAVSFVVTEPVTTAAKAATLNLEINNVNVTGGVIAITSANATPLGKVLNGTAITAGNTFAAGQTVTVEASAVTAFVEGEGDLLITVRVAAA